MGLAHQVIQGRRSNSAAWVGPGPGGKLLQETENHEELLNTFKVEENDSKSIDSTTENNDNLKLEHSKYEQLPEKTETEMG